MKIQCEVNRDPLGRYVRIHRPTSPRIRSKDVIILDVEFQDDDMNRYFHAMLDPEEGLELRGRTYALRDGIVVTFDPDLWPDRQLTPISWGQWNWLHEPQVDE